MRGHPSIYLLAVAFAAASVSASAFDSGIAGPAPGHTATPSPAETATVNNVVRWVMTLNSFKGAIVTNKDSLFGSLMTAERDIRSSDGNLVLGILDDGQLYVDLRARPPWTDADTILLRAIAKHLTGDPGNPITPTMAINAIEDNLPVQYLANGKMEFAYNKASLSMCPWKGHCYSVGIWVTRP